MPEAFEELIRSQVRVGEGAQTLGAAVSATG